MNIHEAVVAAYRWFVYCNRQAAADRRSRRKTEISMRQQAPAQLNALWTPSMGEVLLK